MFQCPQCPVGASNANGFELHNTSATATKIYCLVVGKVSLYLAMFVHVMEMAATTSVMVFRKADSREKQRAN